MLRDLLIAFAALLMGCGTIGLIMGLGPDALMPVLAGVLLLIGTLWERVRYKPVEDGRPGPGWVATDERFVDDESGRLVRVWLEPATGERRYVNE
jgi:hypothetical protein